MRSFTSFLLLLAAGSCSPLDAPAPRHPLEALVAGATPPAPTEATISGRALLDTKVGQARGRLILWWETPEEAIAHAGPGIDAGFFMRKLHRFVVTEPVDIDHTTRFVPFELPLGASFERGDVHVKAVLDVADAFWGTFFGRAAGNRRGWSSPVRAEKGRRSRVDFWLDEVVPQLDREEQCRGEGYELVHVDAPFVRGAVGNETKRRLCVVLPSGYDPSTSQRHPVVYLLPGLGSSDVARLVGSSSLVPSRDELGPEVILVGVDGRTRTGSTYFVDSPVSGQWARFVDVMVGEIDRRYKTIAGPEGRALVGHSTGGFNAVSLGVRRTDLFGAVGASSPDALDFETWLVEERGDERVINEDWLDWMRFEDAISRPGYRQAGQMISYAADFSPAKSTASGNGPPFLWPADLSTGRVEPGVLSQWQAASPSGLLANPEVVETVKTKLGGRLFITVGRGDEFGLFEPAEAFSQKLTKLGVEHTFQPTEGGHFNSESRMREAMRFVIEHLEAPAE